MFIGMASSEAPLESRSDSDAKNYSASAANDAEGVSHAHS